MEPLQPTTNGWNGHVRALYVLDVATGEITEVLQGIAVGIGHEGRATWLPEGDALLVMTQPS